MPKYKGQRARIRAHRIDALTEQDNKCLYCHEPLNARTATADHRVPVSKGGNSARDNIVAACHDCNSAKGSLSEKKYISLIKKPPDPDVSIHIWRAWMRRKIWLRTHKACTNISNMVK